MLVNLKEILKIAEEDKSASVCLTQLDLTACKR